MGLLNNIVQAVNNAQVASAAYHPTSPYTGKLPSKTVKKGSSGASVKAVQRFLNWCINAGLKVDGSCGKKTVSAIKKYQKQYKLKVDGVFGGQSKKKAVKIINKYKAKSTPAPAVKPVTPAPAPTANQKVTDYLTQAELDKWFAALKKQVNNAKKSKYVWVEGPTYANSKKKSTCIAEHSVALQLLGLLPKGGYFYYHPTKKKIRGNRAKYVKKHTELFKLMYPNKKLTTLIKQGLLQPGDIVGFGNPGYHSMVYLGLNSKGKPIFATLGHTKGYAITYPYYAKRKVNMIVRLKKVSK